MYRNEDKVKEEIEPFEVQSNGFHSERDDIDMYLTKDKWYTVLHVGTNGYYYIKEDDAGNGGGYYTFEYFKTVEEELRDGRENKLKDLLG